MGRKNRKPKINVFCVQCVDREWVHRSKRIEKKKRERMRDE